MKRLAALVCATVLPLAALAEEPTPQAVPARDGYAFDYPRTLAQQRLFGIAHGVSLLAAACLDVPATSEALQNAYAAWRSRQQSAIAEAVVGLGAYYRGDDAPADWQWLAKRMGLAEELAYPPESAELRDACATLPQALTKPRYDLAARFRLEERMAITVAAEEIEARDRLCRDRFQEHGFALRVHEARYAAWQEINEPLRRESAAILEREWPQDGPAESFAAWLEKLRRETAAQGGLADCLDFSAALKRPETALRNVFRSPPPPAAAHR